MEEIIEIDDKYSRFDEVYSFYRAVFPNNDEAETKENILKTLSAVRDGSYGSNTYHFIALLIDGKIKAIQVGDYYSDSSICVGEFLGISDELKGTDYGRLLFDFFVDLARGDAKRLHKTLKGMIIEVEDPEYTKRPATQLDFFRHLEFKRVECKYVQPRLSKNKQPVRELIILFKPLMDGYWLTSEDMLSCMRDYFRYGMRIGDPESTEEFKMLKDSLGEEKFAGLMPPPDSTIE